MDGWMDGIRWARMLVHGSPLTDKSSNRMLCLPSAVLFHRAIWRAMCQLLFADLWDERE
jgi:hypothetical protein